MLPILAASALATGLNAGFQFINGLKQQRQADAISVKRPVYQVPTAVSQAVGTAQNLASSAMPGFGQNLARLANNTASTVRAAQESGSPSNALAVIAAAGDSQNNATNALYNQNAQFQRQGAQVLLGQLAQKAQYDDKAWDYNQRKPYEEAAAAKSAFTQAAATNMNSGLAGLGSAATQGLRGYQNADFGLGADGQPATGADPFAGGIRWDDLVKRGRSTLLPPATLPYR